MYPIENAIPMIASDLLPSVLGRSIELQQISDLTRLVRTQKHELPFDGLDSAADPAHPLGLGLRAQFRICYSNLEELAVLSEKAQQGLELNSQNAVYGLTAISVSQKLVDANGPISPRAR